MKFLISYFYQVRNLQPNMIPISTAMFDPKWFHNMTNNNNEIFYDARGIINGIRCKMLSPYSCADLCRGPEACLSSDPETCKFLQAYREQLRNTNFNLFKAMCEGLRDTTKIEDPIFVLLVYEKPDNPCSERVMIKEWFKDNNIELEEFNPNKLY